mmetsp:Transcript_20372/g.60745  ORF Transcript_20372/g.60745 Transcript_20372/m.60745 type:complete len:514 (-) Transcript_20372:40-1581(-)
MSCSLSESGGPAATASNRLRRALTYEDLPLTLALRGRMAWRQKRWLLAVILAALGALLFCLDRGAPADALVQLIPDCARPADGYRRLACAAERANIAHGTRGLFPLTEEQFGKTSGDRGEADDDASGRVLEKGLVPRAKCPECLRALDSIGWVRPRPNAVPDGRRPFWRNSLERIAVTSDRHTRRRRGIAEGLLALSRNATDPWRASALASTARVVLHPLLGPQGFRLFAIRKRAEVTRAFPDLAYGGVRKKVADMWRGLSDAEKEAYTSSERLLSEAIAAQDAALARLPPEPPGEPVRHRIRCPRHLDASHAAAVAAMEPLLKNGRNIDFRDLGVLISFHPYRVLQQIEKTREYPRRILVDVGANEWLGSPKALTDTYRAVGAPFDIIHIFEPKELRPPPNYEDRVVLHGAIEVGSRDNKDIITFLERNVAAEDFVALKFDVDAGNEGPTMEWGFLSDLLHSEALALVDELFIELHFWLPEIHWLHTTHSEAQAFDVLRQLRACGMAVHAWP